jgi:hypothetical protein
MKRLKTPGTEAVRLNWIEWTFIVAAAIPFAVAVFSFVVVICMVLTGTETWP